MIAIFAGCATPNTQIKPFLHPEATLQSIPVTMLDAPHKTRSPEEAALLALEHLHKMGIKQVKICRVNWIFAPVGIYLVDFKGSGHIKGKKYTCFRVAVSDGSNLFSKSYPRQDIEGVIGYNTETKEWYPAPAPKPKELEDRWLYQTLLPDQKQLEELTKNFR